ncbi:MAG: hypothetical protein A4E65_00033 [Syntrophorhabdus sp. PtaU1.Bin153]|nr:MAG: hypothetical protein A4E65_00033 [Syntrophorhabdus sp. PtaU1.Bin153]
MILSYGDIFDNQKVHRVKAELTTDHPDSGYEQPVIVLQDGRVLDKTSWETLGYEVVRATQAEIGHLRNMGLIG